MRRIFVITLAIACVGLGFTGARAESKISPATEECLGCHATIHPGIVEGWKKTRHAATTPAEAQALDVEGLARKITGQNIPEDLKNVSLGCAECHSLNGSSHKDTFDHNGASIHVVVSPKDCATCHVEEAGQFDKNLMAHAHGILVNNSLYTTRHSWAPSMTHPCSTRGRSPPSPPTLTPRLNPVSTAMERSSR